MNGPARPSGDSGATLIVVMILMTVIAVVMGVVLSLTGANVQTTVKLKDQAASSYGVDGAAQVAINELRTNTFPGANCASQATQAWSDWVPASSSAPATSVAVRCTPDANNTGSNPGSNTSPGSALLTLGTSQRGEDGIWDGSTNNPTFKVNGGIFSNSNINLGGKSGGTGTAGNYKSSIEDTSSNSYVFAMGPCPQGAGQNLGTISVTGSTTVTCNYSQNPVSSQDRRGWDPQLVPGHGTSFDPPTPPTVAQAPPACSGQNVYQLQPGLYTNATALNALTASTGSCAGSIVHFNPGTYYFNFQGPGTHKWTTSASYVVAGTPTATLSVSNPPLMTQSNPACVAPGSASATTTSGVLFVFGGDSRMDYTQSSGSSTGNIEICASNANSGPPVAIYGLKSSIGSGQFQVPALGGCITNTPYTEYTGTLSTAKGNDPNHCALIQSYQDPKPIFTIHGTVYAPTAPIDIMLNQSSAQYFQWGLVARAILVSSTGSATAMNNPVISVPNDAPAPFALPSTMYLEVYACPGQSTCSTSGVLQLRIKVQLSVSTPTTVTVLSWSQER